MYYYNKIVSSSTSITGQIIVQVDADARRDYFDDGGVGNGA
jgi:hypothetical protein